MAIKNLRKRVTTFLIVFPSVVILLSFQMGMYILSAGIHVFAMDEYHKTTVAGYTTMSRFVQIFLSMIIACGSIFFSLETTSCLFVLVCAGVFIAGMVQNSIMYDIFLIREEFVGATM